MSTAERRLNIVRELCRKRHSTLNELSEIFGVSVRTIQRDITYISGDMRVPIYCLSGKRDGGVYIDENYTWDKMYMTIDEIKLLKKARGIIEGQISEDEKNLFMHIIKAYSKPLSS